MNIAFGITIILAYYDKIENFTNFDIRNNLGDYIIITLKGIFISILFFLFYLKEYFGL